MAYEQGVGTQKIEKDLLAYYDKSCSLGFSYGCAKMYSLYNDGGDTFKVDKDNSADYAKKACSLGYTKLCNQ